MDAQKSVSMRSLILPIGLSTVVLGIVLWATYEPDTFRLMGQMNVGVMALALGAVGLRILFSGLRLTYLAHGNLSTAGGIRGGLAWDFMSAVTPSAAGGAPLAAYFIARDNRMPVGSATAIMLFSMLADQIWFAVAIPAVLLLAPFQDVIPDTLGAIGAGTLVMFMVLVMLFSFFFAYAMLVRPSLFEWLGTRLVRIRLLRRFEGRVKRELVSMRERSRVLRRQPARFYAAIMGFTTVIWLMRYATLVLVIMAVVPGFDAVNGFLRTMAMMLTGLIIPTPGGSGGLEGLYVVFLAPMMPSALVGPTLITWRLLSYHLFIALGVAVLFQHMNRRKSGKAGRPLTNRPSRRRVHAKKG